MNSSRPLPKTLIAGSDLIVAGVDVGGPCKGFHAVALKNGAFHGHTDSDSPAKIAAWCKSKNATVVAVDAPCKWSATGRARTAERALMRKGIWCFSTPDRDSAAGHPKNHYGWMLNGEALFKALASHYPLFDGQASTAGARVCFETFPQAIACALAGKVVSAKQKRAIRAQALLDRHISIEKLRNIDLIDAALCAVAAHEFASGSMDLYGDRLEGYIVTPRWKTKEERAMNPKESQKETIYHAMPGQEAGDADVSWFDRQNDYEQSVIRQQVKFKREVLRINEDGPFSKKPNHMYPHILPDGDVRRVFYPGLADAIVAYLEGADIQQHSELLNLKSSQAACLNFLFPLRLNHDLATAVLIRAGIVEEGGKVTGVEFEYTAQDEAKKELGCTEWLGEPLNGKRGQHRTSIDAAVFWTKGGKKCATLIEWKYTERSFGSCSAFADADKTEKLRCLGDDYERQCLIVGDGPKRSRHYWNLLAESGTDLNKMKAVVGCPFRGPFYQLMRQFLVAQYMRKAGIAEHIEVVGLHFEGNDALHTLPKELTPLAKAPGDAVIEVWNQVLDGVPPMREIEVTALMEGYDKAPHHDPKWRGYIRTRYGL